MCYTFYLGIHIFLFGIVSKVPFQFFSSAVFPRKIEKMVKDSNNCITRLLFSGPDFPTSNKYSREYLQNWRHIPRLLHLSWWYQFW